MTVGFLMLTRRSQKDAQKFIQNGYAPDNKAPDFYLQQIWIILIVNISFFPQLD